MPRAAGGAGGVSDGGGTSPRAANSVALSPVLSANVLVLNKFYQAIRVVNVRRAFSLL